MGKEKGKVKDKAKKPPPAEQQPKEKTKPAKAKVEDKLSGFGKLEAPKVSGSATSTQAFFLEAYNRRREERARAEEEAKRKAEEEEKMRKDGNSEKTKEKVEKIDRKD